MHGKLEGIYIWFVLDHQLFDGVEGTAQVLAELILLQMFHGTWKNDISVIGNYQNAWSAFLSTVPEML